MADICGACEKEIRGKIDKLTIQRDGYGIKYHFRCSYLETEYLKPHTLPLDPSAIRQLPKNLAKWFYPSGRPKK